MTYARRGAEGLLYEEPFVAVFPSLVRLLGGDVAAAAVLQHLNFRANSGAAVADEEGLTWYPAAREDLAEEIGLSAKQVKRILEKLRDRGVLEVRQMGGIDRRNFYRIDLERADPLVPNGTDGRGPNGTDGSVPDGADVPIMKEEELRRELRRVRKPVDDEDPGFLRFWAAYPRKSAKGSARRAWARAVLAADPEEIVRGAARYAADPNREDQYTAHPATWLNGERWSDGPLPERGTRSDRKSSEVAEMIRRAAERDSRKEIGA